MYKCPVSPGRAGPDPGGYPLTGHPNANLNPARPPPSHIPPEASEPEDSRVAMGKEKSQKPTLFAQRIKKK